MKNSQSKFSRKKTNAESESKLSSSSGCCCGSKYPKDYEEVEIIETEEK